MNSSNVKVKYTWKDKIKAIGPGAMITASFVGPGTVTTATRTGTTFGYSLLWTIVFSIIATIVLQEMAARLGIVTKEGLSEAIKKQFDNPILKGLSVFLVGSSITLGCVAYMGGDLTGTAIGLSTITGISNRILGPIMGVVILLIITRGSIRWLEKLLTFLVALMAAIFVLTMVIVKPDLGAVVKGLMPVVPENGLMLCIALIGTTIVPYNFFIHAISAKNSFDSTDKLELSKWDIYLSISVGGLITAAIMITAATVMHGFTVKSAADLSIQLEPLLGSSAKIFLSIALVAAGLSSAVVTPLGASYVLAGLFGWQYSKKDKRFMTVNIGILVLGIFVSATGFNPLTIIVLAQALNGIILPVVVIYLVYATSSKKILGDFTNSLFIKIVGIVISGITIVLGTTSLVSAIQTLLS
ncbi:Nramp family divalent metal transporter [Anaeromicrobium sediminis]|uniref:Manganese transporter n=1 Tax=Anaeromicrobium sediminis TaxID=1478221 RepID=A0A267MK30_9FIRM|nr:Nramp family divalent metal transporter [Anaeromicrobium sediminis]PAB59807.1 manganese transporter [Anaeromicrobium sediminis]